MSDAFFDQKIGLFGNSPC